MHFRDKVTFAGIKLRKAFDIADPNNMAKASLVWTKVIPFNPKNDQHPISPDSDTAESFRKIMRIKEMIANLESFDCKTYSPSVQKEKYWKGYGEYGCWC